MEPTSLRPYEAVVLVHPDANEEEQKSLFRKNREIIRSFGGELNHLDTWGKRYLANPARRQNRAIFFHATFTAGPNAISELERTMKINDSVLRFMHTRLPDGTNLSKHVEGFKAALAESGNREKERQEKAQKRRGR